MNEIVLPSARITAMSKPAIEKVRALESLTVQMPQEDVATWHVLHGGMYSRTIKIKAGVLLTGAFVRVPTVLIVHGDVTVFANDEEIRIVGYSVLPASAHRKQAFIAHADTNLTMVFKTEAKTVEEAEDEFTEESTLLMSRNESAINFVNITGE